MADLTAKMDRAQSVGEEIANSISHGVGFLLALAGAPILIVSALRYAHASMVVGVSIFSATAILLYLTSTLYHALPRRRAKQVFQLLDHSAIFLLIAGTYTPFTLGVLHGAWGWVLFGLVWGLAVIGLLFKAIFGVKYDAVSTALYIAMGWLVVIAIKPIVQATPPAGLIWLASGGLAYTLGVIFYRLDRLRYAHFVWHLFVLAGTVCHFFAVLMSTWA